MTYIDVRLFLIVLIGSILGGYLASVFFILTMHQMNKRKIGEALERMRQEAQKQK